MKVLGGFLLIVGIVGLLLNLIFWLPAKFNLIAMVVISVACIVAIWGGGKISQSKTVVVREPSRMHQPLMQQEIICPNCGGQGLPGQQFCGNCGARLC